jgi:hypothetical protein
MIKWILLSIVLVCGCTAPRQQMLKVDVYMHNVEVYDSKISGNGNVAVSYSSVW